MPAPSCPRAGWGRRRRSRHRPWRPARPPPCRRCRWTHSRSRSCHAPAASRPTSRPRGPCRRGSAGRSSRPSGRGCRSPAPRPGGRPGSAACSRSAGRPAPGRRRRRSAAAPRSARCCGAARRWGSRGSGSPPARSRRPRRGPCRSPGRRRSCPPARSCGRSGGSAGPSRTSASAASSPVGAVRCECSCRYPERYDGPRRSCVASRDPRGRPTAARRCGGTSAPSTWAKVRSADSSASEFAFESSGWRASTRFSKSLMRSNSLITLRTALCISSCSMSAVIRSTPFSHHSASFTRRCSVLSFSSSPVPALSPLGAAAPSGAASASASFACV